MRILKGMLVLSLDNLKLEKKTPNKKQFETTYSKNFLCHFFEFWIDTWLPLYLKTWKN